MAAETKNTFEGGCHCGAIRWKFRTRIPPSQWTVRACQCSFCRAHGARCTSDPNGSVDFSLEDQSVLQKYRFGFNTADFVICARCGVYVGAVIDVSAGSFATLNLNSMTTAVDDLQSAVPVCYDPENREDRIERRTWRWTPVTSRV